MSKSRQCSSINRINLYLEQKRSKISFKNINEVQIEKLIENWPTQRIKHKLNFPTDSLKYELISQFNDPTESLKPGFLIKIEEKLQNRLEQHGLSDSPPCIERLFIFKEIFEFLIGSFKSYAPLLALIKREYEGVINYYREEVKKIAPAQELIWLVSQHYDNNILEIQKNEFDEINKLKAQVAKYEAKLACIKQDQVDNAYEHARMKDVLAETESKRLREIEYNRTLLTQLNHARVEFETFENIAKNALALRDSTDDPVKLKIALTKAKEAHTKVLAKFSKMEADYGDVIPRIEYEEARKIADEKENELTFLKESYSKMKENIVYQEETIKETKEEYNMIDAQLTALKVNCTPRPDFRQHALLIGGRKRWKEISAGLSTQEKLGLFIQELTITSARPERSSFRILKSFIPTFLGDAKSVHPRLLPLRDVLLVIEDIWMKRKFQLDQFLKKKSIDFNTFIPLPSFDAFMNEYFKQAFGIPIIRKEWALALYTSAEIYTDCEEISRLRKVVDNEMDESYYWYVKSLTNRVFHCLNEISRATIIASTSVTDSNETNRIKRSSSNLLNRLTSKNLQTSLAKLIQCDLQDPALVKLVQVAFTQLKPLEAEDSENEDDLHLTIAADDYVSLEKLFKQDSGEPMPAFVRLLIAQLELGRRAVISHVLIELQRQKNNSVNPERIQISELVEAVRAARPELVKVLEASPKSFISSTIGENIEDNGRRLSIDSDQPMDPVPCDLDETGATREEQALALAWCQKTGLPSNYLLATLNWVFQTSNLPTLQAPSPSEELSESVLEKRLFGANIKPINIITA